MPIIDARDVKVTYRVKGGLIEALRGVSLTLSGPMLVSIMGPSGSGKTTLLKAISGRVRYEGSIRVDGIEVKDNVDFVQRRTIYIPVGGVLINGLTVRETLELASNGRDPSHVLRRLNIAHLANRRVEELSTGEARRVEIAVALVKDRGIVLIDEPTIGLDEANALRITELLRGVVAEGRLVLMATHDPLLALKSDLVYEMRDGLIVRASYIKANR